MTNFDSSLAVRGQVDSVYGASVELRRQQDGRALHPFTPSWVTHRIGATEAQAILNAAGAATSYDHPFKLSIGHAVIMGAGFSVTQPWLPGFPSNRPQVQLVDSSGQALSNNKGIGSPQFLFHSWDWAAFVTLIEGRPLYVADEQLYLRFTSASGLNTHTAQGVLKVFMLTSRLDQRE